MLLINIGGLAGIQLKNKTIGLFNVYQTIQIAENELKNFSIRKRNFHKLIEWDYCKLQKID